MDIYEPAEDSWLLEKYVRQLVYGRVLDVGTGSGIQALAAIESADVRDVLAVDINEHAVYTLKKKIQDNHLRKIKVIKSDLFENVDGSFNIIIFNPPYLPQDKGVEDAALYGGKRGWEISERFFKQAATHLAPTGQILFLFSSLTNKEKIDLILEENLFEFEVIGIEKHAFEELYVYKITKSALLRELERNNISQISYLAKGKRSKVYRGVFEKSKMVKTHLVSQKEKKDVAIKVLGDTDARLVIENEVKWLKVLNKRGIAPRLYLSGENYVVMQYVDGVRIHDWIASASNRDVVSVLRDVLNQCLVMDKMNITKEEMQHPHKHIIVANNTPTLIDFERCHEDLKPSNVTQFVECICRMQEELGKKDIVIDVVRLRELAKEYKDTYSKNVFDEIVRIISC